MVIGDHQNSGGAKINLRLRVVRGAMVSSCVSKSASDMALGEHMTMIVLCVSRVTGCEH